MVYKDRIITVLQNSTAYYHNQFLRIFHAVCVSLIIKPYYLMNIYNLLYNLMNYEVSKQRAIIKFIFKKHIYNDLW